MGLFLQPSAAPFPAGVELPSLESSADITSCFPCSLEKENYDVWAKVVRLNEEVEREKNKFADLECRLQDVERSREDVEKKNKLLEDSIKSMSQAATKDK